MGQSGDKLRVLLFGDRVLDIYYIRYDSPGGYGSDLRGLGDGPSRDHDWQSYQTWDRIEKRGGVDMTREMLVDDGFEVIPTRCLRENRKLVSMPTLRSLGHLKIVKYDKEMGTPLAFEVQHHAERNQTHVMRVAEFLGYSGGVEKGVVFEQVKPQPGLAPNLIVINDAGNELRFSARHEENHFFRTFESALSEAGGDNGRTLPEIIMKTHMPLTRGLAWEAFSRATAVRKTLILSANDLRLEGLPLSRAPTWDGVVKDFRTALRLGNPLLKTIARAGAQVIMLFGVEAALIWDAAGEGTGLNLVFDPVRAEDEVVAGLPGESVGVLNRFMTRLVHFSARCNKPLVEAVKEALLDTRLYAEAGFSVVPGSRRLSYPYTNKLRSAHEDRKKKAKPGHRLPVYSILSITDTTAYSLLTNYLVGKHGGDADAAYVEEARKVVLEGVECTLATCPHGRFGKLWTVDSEEISALRATGRLIDGYLADQSVNKPISIAVFGPPGAGKSFGVKQLVDPEKTPVREYNLSQVREDQLPGFFHDIRDLNLRGTPPLCFFDEFDSQELGLLKSFLAPMQDGTFLDGGALRPIGRAVLVFAGGTANSMSAFAKPAERPTPDAKDGLEVYERAKALKLPDFISRLHLHFNVKGPNAVAVEDKDDVPFVDRKAQDPSYILRRAILLRRFIENTAGSVISSSDKIASIEPALLEVLLGVEDYRHGARSLELLVKAISQNSDWRSLGRSDLPPDTLVATFVKPMATFTRLLRSAPSQKT